MVQVMMQVMQMIISCANICILGYGFYKFLSRPHDNLETRVSTLEVEHREMKASLLKGNDRFREQDDTNEVLIRSSLALIEFEMQYCLIEHKEMSDDLKQAKKDLKDYLAQR